MSAEAFREHWRDRHAPLIVRLPGIRRYVQNYPLPGHPPLFDAVAESSFDDTQAMKALGGTAEYSAVLADEPNFIDRATMGTIVTEEHVLKDGAPAAGGVKALRFVKRDTAASVDDFFKLLLQHGQRVAQASAVRRYAQSHTRRAVYESGRTPAYDAVEMIWLASAQAADDLPVGHSGLLLATERVVL